MCIGCCFFLIGLDIYKKNIKNEPVSTNDISSTDKINKDVPIENVLSAESKESSLKTIQEKGKQVLYETLPDIGSEEGQDKSEDSNASDLGETVPAAIGTYKPSEVYDFCNNRSISDALYNYTVNQNADYSQELYVDLGEAFPDKYKDIDIDGDGLTDSIIRVIGHTGDGCVYGFEFGNGISFVSAPYTMVPNEGELISFYDFDNDNVDEILITHITDSTGGPLAWNCELYSWNGSGWESQWAVDESGAACLAGVDDVLSQEGKAYNVRDVEFTEDGIMYLIDYGQKDGAELTLDLETIQIKLFGKVLYMEERLNVDKRDELTNKIWPFGI